MQSVLVLGRVTYVHGHGCQMLILSLPLLLQVTGWVAMTIVTQPDLRRRAAIIKHFIAIADVGISAAFRWCYSKQHELILT